MDKYFLFKPAMALTRILGCSYSLVAFAIALIAFSVSLTHLALASTQANATSTHSAADILTFASLGSFLLVYFLLGFLLHMKQRVAELNSSAHDIISGNFSTSAFATDDDDLARVQNSMAHIAKEFDRLLKRVAESVSESHSAAEAETEFSNRTSNSSAQQAEAVANISAAIEQMSTSIASVDQQIKETEQSSIHTQDLAEEGADIVESTVNSIQNISSSVNQAIMLIDSLGKRSDEISQIISVIEGIAAQTNLLALNAAIEAARAGEHGRGFAVVSDEVRQLAIRTHDATEQVSSMITGVQDEVQHIITSIEEVNAEVGTSVEESAKINQSLAEIQEGASNTVAIMHVVASAIHEQNAVCEDIAKSIETVNQMAETNSEDAAETKNTALYLETLSERVQTMLPSSDIAVKGI